MKRGENGTELGSRELSVVSRQFSHARFPHTKRLKKSHPLTLNVYSATRRYPKDELFGLTSQTRRASSSIPANIAEGCGRDGGADLAGFLQIANGSASELEYHLLLARDLEFLNDSDWRKLSQASCEVKQMLASLIQKVRQSSPLSNSRNRSRSKTSPTENRLPRTDN
jgi:four helix bundle protein